MFTRVIDSHRETVMLARRAASKRTRSVGGLAGESRRCGASNVPDVASAGEVRDELSAQGLLLGDDRGSSSSGDPPTASCPASVRLPKLRPASSLPGSRTAHRLSQSLSHRDAVANLWVGIGPHG